MKSGEIGNRLFHSAELCNQLSVFWGIFHTFSGRKNSKAS